MRVCLARMCARMDCACVGEWLSIINRGNHSRLPPLTGLKQSWTPLLSSHPSPFPFSHSSSWSHSISHNKQRASFHNYLSESLNCLMELQVSFGVKPNLQPLKKPTLHSTFKNEFWSGFAEVYLTFWIQTIFKNLQPWKQTMSRTFTFLTRCLNEPR